MLSYITGIVSTGCDRKTAWQFPCQPHLTLQAAWSLFKAASGSATTPCVLELSKHQQASVGTAAGADSTNSRQSLETTSSDLRLKYARLLMVRQTPASCASQIHMNRPYPCWFAFKDFAQTPGMFGAIHRGHLLNATYA